ncbi:MAG: hypothetical protein FWG87_11985 [Defluviitaleaceae bacterium]|nr:hypothetical protein [Defluviitaleaceae bacterium]
MSNAMMIERTVVHLGFDETDRREDESQIQYENRMRAARQEWDKIMTAEEKQRADDLVSGFSAFPL